MPPSRLCSLGYLGPLGFLAFFSACLAGCLTARDPYYCEGQPNNYCHDRPIPCRNDAGCPADRPVCNLLEAGGAGTCVQCTAASAAACTGQTPVCGDELSCRACSVHADCASEACLADGSCAPAERVAYAAAGSSDAAPCTQLAPCASLSRALATMRPWLKLSGAFTESLLIEGGRKVTLLAEPGSRLIGAGTGATILVRDAGTSLSIRDLTIADAPNTATGYGLLVPPGGGSPSVELTAMRFINNPAGAVSIAGGSLQLTRSVLLDNLGGGLTIAGPDTTFVVTDNVMAYNGRARAPSSLLGGVAILSNTSGSRFERNTVVYNESGGVYRSGLSCSGPLVAASGNLIFHNGEPDGNGGLKLDVSTQVGPPGGCALGNSLALPTDANNLGFRSPVLPPLDFHLTSQTPALVRDAGGACTGIDLDGQARPAGAACDLGADEYVP